MIPHLRRGGRRSARRGGSRRWMPFAGRDHGDGTVSSTPRGTPQTCGKIERLHQTLKKCLTAQAVQPTTIPQLQALLDRFAEESNTRRPHRCLGRRTPLAAYLARPKATPDPAGSITGEPDTRIRRDRVDPSGVVTLRHHGRLHHIGIGRSHALLLVVDRDIRVINEHTGEVLRELTRDYQPRGHPTTAKGPNP